ncbi:MAG: SDR family NAD(P)-dependent oxidoreductase, partial [Thaumarchaeota archaeon]|nr:SDR family NAD(P)-dependent oxidoreductase [Nitrososphaerota archaeon]
MKAIVLGGSKGIGKAIANSLLSMGCDVTATSRKDIDTSNLNSVKRFIKKHKQTDILVLNTGGPPPKPFSEVTEKEWQKYHNQLFLGFCILLQKLKVRDGGYIFVITSSVIKEPNPRLVISSAYRLAFTAVFKLTSKELAARKVSCVNIAPGLINTDRLRDLGNASDLAKNIPMKRLGEPKEIGD